MIWIGEKLNSSLANTRVALENRDRGAIAALAVRQVQAGAGWLDLNAGAFAEDETEVLTWLVETVMEATSVGLVLDSPNPAVLAAVAPGCAGRDLVLNSATANPEHLEPMLDLAIRLHAGIVLMPLYGTRLPTTVQEQAATARGMLARARDAGLPDDRIYLDMLVCAAAIDAQAPSRALSFARQMRQENAGVHLTGGISNVSYGLPGRRTLHAAFLSAAIQAGVDAPILDVLDTPLLYQAAAATLIAGDDEYSSDYLSFYRTRVAPPPAT